MAAIVEAATRVFAAEGFAGTNVNRVAELAGVSIGSLYQYFPTKEALAGAVAAVSAQTTDVPADRVLASLTTMLERYLLRDQLDETER